MTLDLKTCPSCGAQVTVLITDYKTQKRFCHNCAPEEPSAAAKVSKKIHDHVVAGTLDRYPLEERLKDLRGESDFELPHCKRSDGTLRAWFKTYEEAVKFSEDAANTDYHGDVAHFCDKCGWFHLSKPEWLTGTPIRKVN